MVSLRIAFLLWPEGDELTYLGRAQSVTGKCMSAVATTTRLLASFLPASYSVPMCLLSLGCLTFVTAELWRWLTSAIDRAVDRLRSKGDRSARQQMTTLRLLRAHITIVWPLTWVVWAAAMFNKISFEETEVLYCVADLLNKVRTRCIFSIVSWREGGLCALPIASVDPLSPALPPSSLPITTRSFCQR
ncbi:MAG: hypothetical protein BJ554DRAFT_8456 [Olpidium bornovanus]|uniref:Uncharacterized protein n=1 Tax=Olpidium bornovanus TaxID=278681 RepID=A0A8H7ZUF1_9FUNG|nr:MAG: hypothetical protein BJ554DRAFT_8456 [Olpidium bornovanus]